MFGIEHDELAAAVQQFVVRGGRVRGVRSWVVDKELDIPLGELVESVLEAAYESEEPPQEIIVPALPDDASALEKWLAALRPRGGAVSLRTAQRGDKASVLETATLNAKQALMLYKTRRTADYVARTQALNDIQDALGLDEAPLRMECYDVSHLGGTNIVASMVVFEDGLPKKSAYRKFAVPDYADDTEALSQVLRRRLAHLDEDPEADARRGLSLTKAPHAPRRSASPTGPGCSSSTAVNPRWRPRRAPCASSASTTSRSAGSPSGSRRSGCPGRTSRSSFRATARRSS